MKSKILAIVCVICLAIVLVLNFENEFIEDIGSGVTQILCVGEYGWVSQ